MEFQSRLQDLRTEKGLSQIELGKIIGVSHTAISFWETGINEPKMSYIIALCKYFNVTADYLLGLTD